MQKKVKELWAYAFAIFSVAFVLILMVAMFAGRYHKEQGETREQVQGARNTIETITRRNDQLTEENEQLTLRVQQLEAQLNITLEELAPLKARDKLETAEACYRAGDVTGAKENFNIIDATKLSEENKQKYQSLAKKLGIDLNAANTVILSE